MHKYNYKNFNCKRCGKETVRNSGKQKFCKECSKINKLEWEKNYQTENYKGIKGYYNIYYRKANRYENYQKQYFRENRIHTTNNSTKQECDIIVKKRPYPKNGCEVCGRVCRLTYHHYGEIKPKEFLIGIWVCGLCHWKAEFLDRPEILNNFKYKYFPVKEKILQEGLH